MIFRGVQNTIRYVRRKVEYVHDKLLIFLKYLMFIASYYILAELND